MRDIVLAASLTALTLMGSAWPCGGEKATGPAAGSDAVSSVADELAARLTGYRRRQVGSVTEVSRNGFMVDVGSQAGLRAGLEAEVYRPVQRGILEVAAARVVEVFPGRSRLRRTDRLRRHGIREGDGVRIAVPDLRVLVGGIGGKPKAVTDALRSHLLSSLDRAHDVTVLDGPDISPEGAWPWSREKGLASKAAEAGCSHALSGWAEARGESLHVALGLIDAEGSETVMLYTASVEIDPALASIMAGERPGPLAPASSYVTGLSPAFEITTGEPALAARVIDGLRTLCLVHERSVDLYTISPGLGSPVKVLSCPIESPPPGVPCRDPVAETAYMDSDGDGSNELVVWSSRLAGPVAFTMGRDAAKGQPYLERAETYWLPWAGLLGSCRYVAGTNYLVSPSPPVDAGFYSWETIDLGADGTAEVLLAEVRGKVSARDSSMSEISTILNAGSALAVCDMDGDGRVEAIVAPAGAPGVDDSVIFYSWTGEDFEESWRIDGLPGAVLSLSAGRLDEDDLPDLVAVTRKGPRSRDSRVLFMLTSSR